MTTLPACSETAKSAPAPRNIIRQAHVDHATGTITVWLDKWAPYHRIRRAIQQLECR